MNNYHTTFELHFLLGLPASGKSYWARHNFNANTLYNHTGDFIVDLDKYCKGNLTKSRIIDAFDKSDLSMYVNELFGSKNVVKACIDGLITNIDDLTNVIDTAIDYIDYRVSNISRKFSSLCDIKIYIHQWNEDRDTCLHNDSMRTKSGERNESSSTTIRNHPYEYITKEQLARYSKLDIISTIKFERHVVKKLTRYDVEFAPLIGYDHHMEKSKYVYSESWSCGGSWGDCWGNEGTISAESPLNFNELDNLLEKICPNITYLQYKKIKDSCVSTDEYNEYDYYGGTEYRCRWKCDLEKLYEMLKEMNLIKDYEI